MQYPNQEIKQLYILDDSTHTDQCVATRSIELCEINEGRCHSIL